VDTTAARRALEALPRVSLAPGPSPVEALDRLRALTGARPRLLVKRDDALAFGFGGNKVRKLALVGAQALAAGADTLVTTGGVQSNHCRATAAAATRLGLGCHLVLNGAPPERAAANLLLDRLLGAEVEYVATREERAPALRTACERLRAMGRRPFEIPLGASTAVGAAAFALAFGELVAQAGAPDVIVHSTSSGGTQAGLVAGSVLWDAPTRVIGVSADDPEPAIAGQVSAVLREIAALLGLDAEDLLSRRPILVEDGFVGPGYGVASEASIEAQSLFARSEALFVDHTYTAKAAAGLLALLRSGRLDDAERVVFWHTGGQVSLFA
jgi:1-aminocyclopropane-1-carboxylate deaminase/D-cysteine desulfhydrase-like pyridoxal-dependent ACC family enzyme